MVQVRAIRSEEDYENALARISELMDELSGSEGLAEDLEAPSRIELDVLVDLIELYEERHQAMALPDPISAIKFRMDQANLTARDLMPFIGSRAKVSEVPIGEKAHHHVNGPGPAPTPGDFGRGLVAGTGGYPCGYCTGLGVRQVPAHRHGKTRLVPRSQESERPGRRVNHRLD